MRVRRKKRKARYAEGCGWGVNNPLPPLREQGWWGGSQDPLTRPGPTRVPQLSHLPPQVVSFLRMWLCPSHTGPGLETSGRERGGRPGPYNGGQGVGRRTGQGH